MLHQLPPTGVGGACFRWAATGLCSPNAIAAALPEDHADHVPPHQLGGLAARAAAAAQPVALGDVSAAEKLPDSATFLLEDHARRHPCGPATGGPPPELSPESHQLDGPEAGSADGARQPGQSLPLTPLERTPLLVDLFDG
jgi:hypothetical protein